MKHVLFAAALVSSFAASASAETAVFATGRRLPIAGHRLDGDALVLTLVNGGELTCAPSLIAEILPDEIPPAPPEIPKQDPPAAVAAAPRLLEDPRYEPIIKQVAAKHGVDVALVRAVIQVESAYEARARSPKGAVGLMQVMPATGQQFGVRNLYDPGSNIEAGISYLKSLLDHLPLNLALAAYNAGEAAVQRFQGVPPYPETEHYVASILALLLPQP